MAITSTAAVETEYGQRRDVIRAYDAASIDAALEGLDGIAVYIDEALWLFQAREILGGRMPVTDPTGAPVLDAARSIREAASAVRAAITLVKTKIPD